MVKNGIRGMLMPRRARRLSESKIYHIIIRGNERQNIFRSAEDKEKFLEILRIKRKEGCYEYLAYCLMDNHVHLIIDQGEENIAKIMQGINVRYAQYFNKRYDRIGHLFQDRFKSEEIGDDRYLLAAVRYIHNNPVKVGMVETPANYRWSSYNSYINSGVDLGIVNCKIVRSIFSEEKDRAITLFKEFSMLNSEDTFIDLSDKVVANEISIQNEEQARDFVLNYLRQQHIEIEALKNDKQNRNALIIQLKNQSRMSVRGIANLLGLDRNMIQRIK